MAATPARAHLDTVEPVAPVAVKFDVLVYKDGDRVKGRLKEKTKTEYVFQSDRFGLLHVPLADATVTLGSGDKSATADAKTRGDASRNRADEAEGPFNVWSLFSVRALTTELRDFFGPWHGRFAMSAEADSDTTERTNYTVEAHLKRAWARDNVQLNARYDYSDTDHVVTTDVFKADASWRHDFTNTRYFAIYGPSVEWNRAFFVNALPADYILLQQELGVGVNIFNSPQRSLRVGISENLFDLWQTVAPASHNSKTAESLFVETDWKLPWRMTLTERGVWYYSINTRRDGWENKIELDKKLTETFTVGIRHEIRYNNPGVLVQDYTLLKFLMGIDF